jgi:hypothetical protein
MASVADQLRREDAERLARLSAGQRLELAFALGDADADAYCRSHGVDRRAAIRVFQRQRQRGRNPSRCMIAIIG